jgi:hypothetical protein
MQALVATHESQGARSDDFDWCIDGELVWLPEVCPNGRRGAICDCVRAFAGVSSHRYTTTAVVREVDGLTIRSCLDIVRYSLAAQGLPAAWVPAAVDRMLLLAANTPPGVLLERKLDVVAPRFDRHTGRLLPSVHLEGGLKRAA